MDFEEYPLLHYPDLMHTLLKVARDGPASLEDVAKRVRTNLRLAREAPPIRTAEMLERLERCRRYLTAARAVEPLPDGRFRLSARGDQVLHDHPDGVDDSVLMAFPEFRAFIRKRGGPAPEPADATIHDSGHAAYHRGAQVADNPYPFDTAAHLAWENGWFEARDEDAEHGGGNV